MPDTLDAAALFETHHERIHRYILHFVRNSAEAEDLTQETFLRAHRRFESLHDPGAVRSWLYRIATHVCLDRLRQHKAQLSLEGEDGASRLQSIAGMSPSALEAAERKETSECVQRCLQFLPDTYRAVILMHEVYSLTAKEIAGLTDESLTAVKMRLHRARRTLKMVMECGCSVSNDLCGLPVCQPRPELAARYQKRDKRSRKSPQPPGTVPMHPAD